LDSFERFFSRQTQSPDLKMGGFIWKSDSGIGGSRRIGSLAFGWLRRRFQPDWKRDAGFA
jgi:hypothetical protein